MNDFLHPTIDVDVIINQCHILNVGLAKLCYQERPMDTKKINII